MRIATLTLTVLCLALAAPAFADTTFISSGPIDGNDNAFFVTGPNHANFLGSVQDISDGFIAQASGTPTAFTWGLWVASGAKMNQFNVELGTTPFGSDIGSASWSCSNACGQFLFTNGFGYDVYSVNFPFSGSVGSLTAGQEYWFSVSNAWDDQASGSDAWDIPNGGLGTSGITCNFRQSGTNFGDCGVGGESFTITGGQTGVPEPSSIMLLGSGILGFAGVLRRKLNR